MVHAPDVIAAPARPEDSEPDDGDDGEPRRPVPTGRRPFDRLEYWVGVAIVAACCIYVFVQLDPKLVLRNTTVTGGDTGAHVWFPDFLIDHFLPWRVAGWSNDFYAGFPAGQFYFPFPAVLIAILDVFLPYNVAFKLVTALGPIAFPVGAYVFARGIRAPRPAAPLFAVAATAFMFFKDGGDATMTFDFHIMGGTLASTLAGEFSFMLALALALFFLGTLARALDRRGPMWLPALLLALTVTSHLVVAIFAVLAGVVLWLIRRPVRNFTRVAAIGAVGVLLTAFWLLPLVVNLGNTTDMRYEPIGNYLDWMFLSENWFLYPLAVIALGAGIWYRRRATLYLAALTVMTGLVFYNWEGLRTSWARRRPGTCGCSRSGTSCSSCSRRWASPSWRASAALGVGVGGQGVRPPGTGSHARRGGGARAPRRPRPTGPTRERAGRAWWHLAQLRAGDRGSRCWRWWRRRSPSCASSRPATSCPTGRSTTTPATRAASTADFTAKSWPEYRAFLDTANSLPSGRMAWEGGDAIGAYGTPLALMLLPYWTHGRIQSMEGLYFEASTTTPYHFMMIATLAQSPSNPVRGLPYRSITDFDLGVRYLQLMGVRYYAAFTDEAKAAAAKNASLRPVATVPDLDRQAAERVDDLPGRRLADGAGARLPAGGRRRPARRALVAVRGAAGAGRGHHAHRRVQPLGVHRGAVVQRPGRARPTADRRRAVVVGPRRRLDARAR